MGRLQCFRENAGGPEPDSKDQNICGTSHSCMGYSDLDGFDFYADFSVSSNSPEVASIPFKLGAFIIDRFV